MFHVPPHRPQDQGPRSPRPRCRAVSAATCRLLDNRRTPAGELAEIAEFDRSPITDIKHCKPAVRHRASSRAASANAENVHVLRELRANARVLVALRRPARSTAACRRSATTSTSATCLSQRLLRIVPATAWATAMPNDPELPLLLDKVHPINEVVRVDYFIPGCPAVRRRHLEIPDRSASTGRIPRLEHPMLQIRLIESRPHVPNWKLPPILRTLKPHRHRPRDPRRGSRQGDRCCSTTPTASIRCASTSSSSAASRSSSKGVPSGKCRSPCSGSAASARSPTSLAAVQGDGPDRRVRPRCTARPPRSCVGLMHYGQMVQSACRPLLPPRLARPAARLRQRFRRGATSSAWRSTSPRSPSSGRAAAQVRSGSHPP